MPRIITKQEKNVIISVTQKRLPQMYKNYDRKTLMWISQTV